MRSALAVLLLFVGLAPVGAPIFSDSVFRQALQIGGAHVSASPTAYRWQVESDGSTLVQRRELSSAAGGEVWDDTGVVPDAVSELAWSNSNPHLVFARTASALWRSDDAGETWNKASLPGRPLSLAVAPNTPGLIVVGMESLGLYRSGDEGQTWQAAGQALETLGPGVVGVSAVAFNAEDDRIVYAAPGYWLGTSQVRFSPTGLYLSVDGGQRWFEMANLDAGRIAAKVEEITPLAGRPLAVTTTSAQGERAFELAVTPRLVAMLDEPDRGARAAAARILGLSGNHSMVSVLMAHLRDDDLFVGDQIAEALGRLTDPTAIPGLMEALGDPDEGVRARAAYALGLLRARQATPQLAHMLLEDGPLAQGRAAEALAAIGSPQAVSALLAPLSDGTQTAAGHAAMRGLERAGRDAIVPLAGVLASEDAAVRRSAAEMLGWLAPEMAGNTLVVAQTGLAQALRDGEPEVRAEAAWALGEIGTPDARRALARSLRDETNQLVLQAAQQATARTTETALQHPDLALSPAQALMDALSRVPVSRWTFLGLVIVLATVLLAASPRQLQLERS